MKQSKKLLSIFLAMLMLIGTVSVVGSAAKEEFSKSTIAYDSIDNAALTAEQVADIVLDMVDDMLKDIDLSDINDITSALGINLDLSSINKAAETVYGLKDIISDGIMGIELGGDLNSLNVNAFNGLKRENGDISVVVGVLKFLADNFGGGANIQKAVYGIGKDSAAKQFGVGGILWEGKVTVLFVPISLGFSVQKILEDPDLLGMGWSVKSILANLPGFIKQLVFDMVMYGSYPYSSDGVNKEYSEVKDAFTNVTLDGMVDIILKNFLTTPQDYKYVPTGEVDAEGNPITKKVWDESSYLLSTQKYDDLGDLSLANNSLFDFIDKVLQIAYEDFGTVFLNNDLKKNLMRAMGVDFVTLDEVADAAEIDKITKPSTGYIDPDGTNSAKVKNYFCNAQMWKVDGTWYYRGYKTVATGEVDAEGNAVTTEKDIFQRANIGGTDSLFNLINWDYNFTGETLNFNTMISTYGSIIGSLNHILFVLLRDAINYSALDGNVSVTDIWTDGSNENFNENLMTIAKFLLTNFTFKFFGRNEAYVDLNTFKAKPEFVDKINSFGNDAAGREGLIAYMLLPFLGDALPQLVYDMDMFTPGLQIEQTAALLVREFLSDLTPQINYDDQIFVAGTLTSASGRKFKTHTSAEWMDIILNMGLDLAMTYLDNITNINVTGDGLKNLHKIAENKEIPSWKVVLEEIVDWAVLYIGNGENGALAGLSPKELGAVRCVTDGTNATETNYAGNAFNILSTALNAILPLGLLCNVTSYEKNEDGSYKLDDKGNKITKHALDVEMVFNRLVDVIDDLDLEVLLATFGRNGRTDNILTSKNVLAQVLGLVNKLLGAIWGRNLINDTTSLQGFLSQDNLAALLVNLIDGLYTRSDNLLRALLPTVAQFIPDWGGEQVFRSPEINIDTTMTFGEGSGSGSFTVENGSKRVWRGYINKKGDRQQDEQYKMIIEKVDVYGANYGKSAYMTVSGGTGTYDFGGAAKVDYSISGLPAEGALARVEVTYKVTGYDGSTPLTTESLKTSKWIWLNGTNGVGTQTFDTGEATNSKCHVWAYGGNVYIDNTNISSAVSDINGFQAYTASKEAAVPIVGSKRTISCTISGNNPQYGITAPASYSKNIKEAVSGDVAYFKVTDSKALAAAPFGSVAKWDYSCKADSESASGSVYFIFYDGTGLDLLRSVVDKELSNFRDAEDYDTSSPACTRYVEALEAAARVARQNFTADIGKKDFETLRTNLEAAIEAIEAVKKSENTTASAIATLKNTVNSVESQLGGYRTYALYRWNRFYDVYSEANSVFATQEKVNLGLETMNFNESPLTANEASTLIPANDNYKKYIEALYVAKTEEEAESATREYNDAKDRLASYNLIDLANINNLLPAMKERLLSRDGGVVNTYLSNELASAKAVIGNNSSKYTAKSWAVYAAALSKAEGAMTSTSQDTIFDAKYQLQVARNNLVLAADAADYKELETLITQAENALRNASYYKNADIDFGKVLAALGYEVNGTEIFPGAAKDVFATSYSKHDQDEIDDAADELKAALAKLEFKDFASKKPSGVTSTPIATGEEDETGNPVTENIYTKTINPKQVKSAVADALAVSGCTVEVSLDSRYSASSDANLDKVPVGTGATVTILQKVGGVNVPVATIKLIVEGDITGDGVVDALDCMIADLCKNKQTSLDGVYLIAGDIAEDTEVMGIKDFEAIVNEAVKVS